MQKHKQSVQLDGEEKRQELDLRLQKLTELGSKLDRFVIDMKPFQDGSYQRELETVQSRKQALRTVMEQIKDSIAKWQSEREIMASTFGQLEANMSDIKNNLRIRSYKLQVAANSSKISELEEKIRALDTDEVDASAKRARTDLDACTIEVHF